MITILIDRPGQASLAKYIAAPQARQAKERAKSESCIYNVRTAMYSRCVYTGEV
jgi:hypothetical protein